MIKKNCEIANKLKFIHGDHCMQQLYTLATEIMETYSGKIDKYFNLETKLIYLSINF